MRKLKLIRIPEVRSLTGRSRTSIFSDIRGGLLPPSIRLGARAIAFYEHEILAAVTARGCGRSDSEIRNIVSALVAERESIAEEFMPSANTGGVVI